MFKRRHVEAEILAERNRCVEIFRDAVEKLACQFASEGKIPVSEITRRTNRARDEFLKMASEAAAKATSEKV